MWDKIKKAINSNLAKPLDTFMTEQFNSWATQRGRLDTTISSRATNDGVWAYTGKKTLSVMQPSSTTVLSLPGPYTVPSGTTNQTIVKIKTGSIGGNYKITFFAKVSNGNYLANNFSIVLNVNGIPITYTPSGANVNTTGTTLTIASAFFPSFADVYITRNSMDGVIVTISNIVISGSPSDGLLYL